MTESRNEDSPGRLAVRPQPASVAARGPWTGYFWMGVAILIAVALAYPFYAHEIQRRLAARDVAAAVKPVTPPAAAPVRAMTAAEERQAVIAARDAAAPVPAESQQGVRVMGTTFAGKNRAVIVQMGQASLAESKTSLCTQAANLFREDLSGVRLSVQRDRGTQPAEEAGTVTCD